MSATAEASQAIHANTLTDLPTQQVLGIYKYAWRMWQGMPVSNPQEPYYFRMLKLSLDEIQRRGKEAQKTLAEFVGPVQLP